MQIRVDTNHQIQVLTPKPELLKFRFAEHDQTRCLNGYNPLLEDYLNMTMFVTHWDPPKA